MIALLQRCKEASVECGGEIVSRIGEGYAVLLGVAKGDTEREAELLAKKVAELRIFEDENGKMNLSPDKVNGEILIVYQFTLYGDCSSRRPGFIKAARPETAIPLYEKVIELCRERGFKVSCGRFGADMKVSSVNDGPVTLIMDTAQL